MSVARRRRLAAGVLVAIVGGFVAVMTFGWAIWRLRCPLCGHAIGAAALRRSECGFDERREG